MAVPNYCLIFHANINYAFLTPDKYEFVIRNSYEKLVDLFEIERWDAGCGGLSGGGLRTVFLAGTECS